MDSWGAFWTFLKTSEENKFCCLLEEVVVAWVTSSSLISTSFLLAILLRISSSLSRSNPDKSTIKRRVIRYKIVDNRKRENDKENWKGVHTILLSFLFFRHFWGRESHVKFCEIKLLIKIFCLYQIERFFLHSHLLDW